MLHRIKRPPAACSFLLSVIELAEGGAGKIFHVAEVQEQLSQTLVIHQAEQLIADYLDVLLVQDFAVHEVNDGNIADMLDLKTAAARLR